MKPALIAAISLSSLIFTAPRCQGEQPVTYAHKQTSEQLYATRIRLQPPGDTKAIYREPPHWYKSSDWPLVIVGFVTALVIGWQSYETMVASRAAKNNAEAALKNIDIYINKERVRLRVSVNPLELTPDELGFSLVRFRVSSHGPTDAFILGSGVEAFVLPVDEINNSRLWNPKILPIPTFPTEFAPNKPPVDCSSILELSNSEEIASRIRDESLTVVLRGFIKYRDVFDRERRMSFRYYWQTFRLLAGLASEGYFTPGEWVPCGPPEDNQET